MTEQTRDLTPKNDVIFKLLFGNHKHTDYLIHLLNVMLKPKNPIVRVWMQPTELTPETFGKKGIRLDISAITSNNEIIDIEIQKKDEHDFLQRSLFYLARLFINQRLHKNAYKYARKTIVIAILNFKLFDDDEFWHHHCWIDERTGKRPHDLQEIHYYELPKVRNRYDMRHDYLWFWLKFIDNPDDEEIKSMYKLEKIFRSAKGEYHKCIADEKTLELIRAKEDAERDYDSAMCNATEKGMAKGLQQGLQQGALQNAIKTAKNALSMGLAVDQIVKLTGLPVGDIQALRG